MSAAVGDEAHAEERETALEEAHRLLAGCPSLSALPHILCEDGPLLAVHKPAGLLTQGVPHGIITLEAWVRQYLKTRYHKPGNVYLGIPHRLDRPVSGVVVFARNSKAASRLAEQFQQHRVQKIYWCLTRGIPEPAEQELIDWLWKEPERAHVRVVPAGTPAAREARLHYRTLATGDGVAWLEIRLFTGRMHQIRVQLASRGWPIVGDNQYASAGEPAHPREQRGRVVVPHAFPGYHAQPPWIALHAHTLTVYHPIRYDTVTLHALPPYHWRALHVPERLLRQLITAADPSRARC